MRRRWRIWVTRANGSNHGEVARSDEAGDTLVEVLLALIVLSLTSVAVIVAFSTTISASAEHRSLTTFNTMIRSATEQATQEIEGNSAVPYLNCAPLAYYQGNYPTTGSNIGLVTFSAPPSGTNYKAAITNVGYWSGTGFVTGSAAQAACNTLANEPQEITVTVTDPANNTNYSNSFVVDDSVAVPPVPVCTGSQTANSLIFNVSPSGASAGSAFTQQPIVWVENDTATPCVVTSDLSPVKLTITAGTGQSGANLLNCFAADTSGSGVVTYENCEIDTASNTAYTLTATDNNGALTAFSSSFYVIAQLSTPAVTGVTTSTNGPGAVTVTFTPPGNAQAGQAYTAIACTNMAMNNGCTSPASITSGTDISGLTAGIPYYVEVTAVAGNGFLASTSPVSSSGVASATQIGDPGTPTLAYGGRVRSINVTFPGSNPAIPGETYGVQACTNAGMSTGCVSGPITSGSDFAGLATITPGVQGTQYWVIVTANAINGFTNNPSAEAGPQRETSQAEAPVITAVGPGSGAQKRLSVTFTTSGSGIGSVSALVCTNTQMNAGCNTTTNYTTGSNINVANHAGTYFVELTAVGSAGYVDSAVSNKVSGTSS